MWFKHENSDINTVVRTGNLIKEVREAETRRMMHNWNKTSDDDIADDRGGD